MLSKRMHSQWCGLVNISSSLRTFSTPARISGIRYNSSFSGVIDHIFVSTGEKNSGLAISGVLAFPPGAHLAGERAVTPEEPGKGGADDQRRATALGEPWDGQKLTDGPTEEAFPPIPNELWGSDHLALGVEVTLL